MGHEFVGEVVEVGSAVKLFRPGSQVFSPFTTSCGSCSCCATGLTCRCRRGQLLGWVESGVGLHGAQAEMVKVPLADSTLLELPEGFSDEQALLLGDNLATGYYGALRAGVTAGESCLVVGCGTVGLLAVLCCGELGADPIYAVDLKESRRRRAARLGAVALAPEEAVGLESASVIEAVGNLPAMKTAFERTAPGGTLASVGVHTSQGFAFTPVDLYDRNLTYRSGRCPARALAPELVPMARAQSSLLRSLFTHSFPLTSGVEAYRLFERGDDDCQKVILTI
jgi:2-desacetyl-2-hydroxyethyl bacteriochlorophyllide A dehydrogenase